MSSVSDSSPSSFRTEKDSMGEMRVPADAYYGAQTARAVENFPISSLRFAGCLFVADGRSAKRPLTGTSP